MSASDALTIWMLSTAMNAPSVAPATASQIFGETAGSDVLAALVVCARSPLTLGEAVWSMAGWSAGLDDALPDPRWPGLAARLLDAARSDAGRRCLLVMFGEHGCLGIDGRLRRHAWAQQAGQVAIVQHDL